MDYTPHQTAVILELRKTLATLQEINANLQRSLKATSSPVTAPPGLSVTEGSLVKEQRQALEKVAVWEDLLGQGRVAPAGDDDEVDMEY